jgi:hypothetical protein
VSDDQIELRTTVGNVKVALTSRTKIENGKETADRTHLKAGEHISVFGTSAGRLRRSQHVIEGASRAWKNNCTVKR